MSEKAQSLEEIYASYQSIEKVYAKDEQKKMDEDLAELPVDLRDSLTFQIDKINFACKKLSG
jgi:hypothetical protein